jgi:hypothetical protein
MFGKFFVGCIPSFFISVSMATSIDFESMKTKTVSIEDEFELNTTEVLAMADADYRAESIDVLLPALTAQVSGGNYYAQYYLAQYMEL